jgi:hypothetical protein
MPVSRRNGFRCDLLPHLAEHLDDLQPKLERLLEETQQPPTKVDAVILARDNRLNSGFQSRQYKGSS